jgi:hypothetical protein
VLNTSTRCVCCLSAFFLPPSCVPIVAFYPRSSITACPSSLPAPFPPSLPPSPPLCFLPETSPSSPSDAHTDNTTLPPSLSLPLPSFSASPSHSQAFTIPLFATEEREWAAARKGGSSKRFHLGGGILGKVGGEGEDDEGGERAKGTRVVRGYLSGSCRSVTISIPRLGLPPSALPPSSPPSRPPKRSFPCVSSISWWSWEWTKRRYRGRTGGRAGQEGGEGTGRGKASPQEIS